eukprot:MONOS_9966.1-p1 / transcript=MONOS_9966.1 / gene=MONOS_9966 / organism=Monocercomonoides_exilis_PA203 / gene_product=unspecified product / transcript_product=unspecified product / location=Mono_scaffold00432:16440-22877(-) / protein_length=2057 / sequence_SO=supercontig / SO=protein_coding / is_pseudo=false
MFNDAEWPSKCGIKPEQIPPAFKDKLGDVTETLKELYKNGVPSNLVNAFGTVSEKHGIPLPTTSKFINLVNSHAIEYYRLHPVVVPEKKRIIFRLRQKDGKENGNERVFRKVRIVIRDENGEEMSTDEWRRQFMKQQDFSDFSFETVRNRFMQLDQAQQRSNVLSKRLPTPQGVVSDTLAARLIRYGGIVRKVRPSLRSKVKDQKDGKSLKEDNEEVIEEEEEEDTGRGRIKKRTTGKAGASGRRRIGGSGRTIVEGEGGEEEEEEELDANGTGRKRVRRSVTKTAGALEGEGGDLEAEGTKETGKDESASTSSSSSSSSSSISADDEDEGYDYGVVQTIVMDSKGNVVSVEEHLAEEGEEIDVSKGDLDGRDERFQNIKRKSEADSEKKKKKREEGSGGEGKEDSSSDSDEFDEESEFEDEEESDWEYDWVDLEPPPLDESALPSDLPPPPMPPSEGSEPNADTLSQSPPHTPNLPPLNELSAADTALLLSAKGDEWLPLDKEELIKERKNRSGKNVQASEELDEPMVAIIVEEEEKVPKWVDCKEGEPGAVEYEAKVEGEEGKSGSTVKKYHKQIYETIIVKRRKIVPLREHPEGVPVELRKRRKKLSEEEKKMRKEKREKKRKANKSKRGKGKKVVMSEAAIHMLLVEKFIKDQKMDKALFGRESDKDEGEKAKGEENGEGDNGEEEEIVLDDDFMDELDLLNKQEEEERAREEEEERLRLIEEEERLKKEEEERLKREEEERIRKEEEEKKRKEEEERKRKEEEERIRKEEEEKKRKEEEERKRKEEEERKRKEEEERKKKEEEERIRKEEEERKRKEEEERKRKEEEERKRKEEEERKRKEEEERKRKEEEERKRKEEEEKKRKEEEERKKKEEEEELQRLLEEEDRMIREEEERKKKEEEERKRREEEELKKKIEAEERERKRLADLEAARKQKEAEAKARELQRLAEIERLRKEKEEEEKREREQEMAMLAELERKAEEISEEEEEFAIEDDAKPTHASGAAGEGERAKDKDGKPIESDSSSSDDDDDDDDDDLEAELDLDSLEEDGEEGGRRGGKDEVDDIMDYGNMESSIVGNVVTSDGFFNLGVVEEDDESEEDDEEEMRIRKVEEEERRKREEKDMKEKGARRRGEKMEPSKKKRGKIGMGRNGVSGDGEVVDVDILADGDDGEEVDVDVQADGEEGEEVELDVEIEEDGLDDSDITPDENEVNRSKMRAEMKKREREREEKERELARKRREKRKQEREKEKRKRSAEEEFFEDEEIDESDDDNDDDDGTGSSASGPPVSPSSASSSAEKKEKSKKDKEKDKESKYQDMKLVPLTQLIMTRTIYTSSSKDKKKEYYSASSSSTSEEDEEETEALDSVLDDLQPFINAGAQGVKQLKKKTKHIVPSEEALKRISALYIAELFKEEKDLAEARKDLLKEKPYLVPANLIEVELTTKKGRREEHAKYLDAKHKDTLYFLSQTSKTKGLKAIDNIIKTVVNKLKEALVMGDRKTIWNAYFRVIALFYNRSAVTKVKVMADDELIKLIMQQLRKNHRGRLLDLVSLLSLLSRLKETHESFLNYKVIPYLTAMFMSEKVRSSIVLFYSEMICFLSATPACRTLILQQGIMKRVAHVLRQQAYYDQFVLKYLTGFLYQVSTSTSEMEEILRASAEKSLIDQLKQKFKETNDDLARLTTGALVNLSVEQNVCQMIVVRGGITDLFHLAEEFKDGFFVIVRNSLHIMNNVLETRDGRVAVGREAPSVIPLLTQIVSIHRDVDEGVVKYGCSILHFYATQTKDNLDLLFQSGVLQAVSATVNDHKRFSLDTIHNAVGVLCAMSLSHKQSRAELENSDVVPILSYLLSKYCSTNTPFTELLLGIMYGLCFVPKNQKIFGGLGAVTSIMEVITQNYRTCPVVVKNGLGALAQLVSTFQFSTQFFAADGMNVLDDVLRFYMDSPADAWPIAQPGDDHRKNTYRGAPDILDIKLNLTGSLVAACTTMSDEQKKQYIKLNIVNTLKDLMERSIGVSQALCENCCSVLFTLKVPRGPFSDFKKIISKAKKEYPDSTSFKDS